MAKGFDKPWSFEAGWLAFTVAMAVSSCPWQYECTRFARGVIATHLVNENALAVTFGHPQFPASLSSRSFMNRRMVCRVGLVDRPCRASSSRSMWLAAISLIVLKSAGNASLCSWSLWMYWVNSSRTGLEIIASRPGPDTKGAVACRLDGFFCRKRKRAHVYMLASSSGWQARTSFSNSPRVSLRAWSVSFNDFASALTVWNKVNGLVWHLWARILWSHTNCWPSGPVSNRQNASTGTTLYGPKLRDICAGHILVSITTTWGCFCTVTKPCSSSVPFSWNTK